MRTRVLIVGGGLAGMTLANALGEAGVGTVIVDRDPIDARTAASFDGRTTAIAHASKMMMEAIGLWQSVAADAAPILDIRIADGRAPVFLHYDHREVGDDAFGHIVENRLLRLAQAARLRALQSVTVISGVAVAALGFGPGLATATLGDGRQISAELVVGADGRSSFVRRTAGIDTMSWRYRQKAIACTIRHERPHKGVAVEHFMPAGPFAVLPMTDDGEGTHRSSIVWTEQPDRADGFAALPEPDFDYELQDRIGDYLGQVALVGGRWVYPLGVIHAKRYIGPRLALVSEAAHGIHPIAGQGLNMGLRDIAALAEVIVEAARVGRDVGHADDLARYQRWRRLDNVMLVAVTDGLNRMFSNRIPPVRLARDFGLGVVGQVPPLKRFFMRHAMGVVGDLPRLLRGEAL